MLRLIKRLWMYFYRLQEREKQYVFAQIKETQGLFPLLMKVRNGEKWTREERCEIAKRLRQLSSLGPYLIPLLLPGGIFLLPLLAWWLDRRRAKRHLVQELPQSEL